MPHDDRPEHIHMVVCGVAFVLLWALLRAGHIPTPLAEALVLVLAIPLMGWLAPISFWFYFALFRNTDRHAMLKRTDAGCSTLVFLFFAWIVIGILLGALEKRGHLPFSSGASLANSRRQ